MPMTVSFQLSLLSADAIMLLLLLELLLGEQL